MTVPGQFLMSLDTATRSVAEAADEALPRTMITAINLP
jgi:hypothetical protein